MVRWRLKDLAQWIWDEFRTSLDETTVGRELKAMGFAKMTARPRHHQRTEWAYIFGAICPAKGKRAGLVMPYCTSHAMTAHLAEISQAVDANAYAAVLLDQAGWHLSAKVQVPDDITPMPLPPRSPELNSVANIWQLMRDNWLSNRVFTSCQDIVDRCCYAWNILFEQPWVIMSIGLRKWAHRRSAAQVGISY